MSRVLGIDYGTKRIGLAMSDDAGTMAFPYSTIDAEGALNVIQKICKDEHVSHIVLGLPKALSNMQDTEMTGRVRAFAEQLKSTGLPWEFEEEFLSSAQASRATGKETIDASAAALILQTHLERKRSMVQ